MKKLKYICPLLVMFLAFLANSASADVGFIEDQIYITCVDKGSNRFEIFGTDVELPDKFFKRISKVAKDAERYVAGETSGGANDVTNICTEASDHLQHNELEIAKQMFERAYKLKPSLYAAQTGYLRFHIAELVDKVIEEPKDLEKVFKPFKTSGQTIVKEYSIGLYIQIVALLSNEKSKKRIVSAIGKDLKSLRSKLQKILKKDTSDSKDEILKLLREAKQVLYTPTNKNTLANNKYTEDIAKKLIALDKVAEYLEYTEKHAETDKFMNDKLTKYLTSVDIGESVNKKINDDNVKIREKNSKFAAYSTKEKELLIQTNDYREILGLKRLLADSSLSKASSDHAYIMNKDKKLTHKSYDGSGPTERAQKYGYKPELVGEIIQTSTSEDDSAETILINWIVSKDHNEVLMNAKLEEIGIGNNGLYWVQMFGIPE